jgi:hypothetical protein
LDPYNRINFKPNFRQESLPCDGNVGDLVILTPLAKDERDGSNDGLASVWVCIKASWGQENERAVWARLQFDGVGTCQFPVPQPPQDHPPLNRG